MILISYDIADDKIRNKFSKYLLRFGRRLQYSVYEIDNSPRILNNIVNDIKNTYMPIFDENDSVLLLKLSKKCEVIKMGHISHEDDELIIV